MITTVVPPLVCALHAKKFQLRFHLFVIPTPRKRITEHDMWKLRPKEVRLLAQVTLLESEDAQLCA